MVKKIHNMEEDVNNNYHHCIIDNYTIFYVQGTGTAGISIYKNMKVYSDIFYHFSTTSVLKSVKEIFTIICLDIINRVDVGIVNWKDHYFKEIKIECRDFNSLKEFMEFLECNM